MQTLDNSNNVFKGTPGDDTIEGGLGDDVLRGGTGDDVIDGGGNNDRLFGGDGNDVLFSNGFEALNQGEGRLFGGAGNDVLFGGTVNDILVGGTGDDDFIIAGGRNTATGGAGSDSYAFFADAFSTLNPGTTVITDFNINQDSFFSQIGTDQFSDLRFSGSNILGASSGKVVFTLEGVDTADLTAANFSNFQGSIDDVVV